VDGDLKKTGLHPHVKAIGDELMRQGIEIRPGFYPMRRHPAFPVPNGGNDQRVTTADCLTHQGLCFPSHPGLSDEDVSVICEKIDRAWKADL
jgi:dTDP-4-amino-4,6-dideoxygalactose transaminase